MSDICAMCPNHLNLHCVNKSPMLSTMPKRPASSAVVRRSLHCTVLLTPKIQRAQRRWKQSNFLTNSWVGAQASAPYNNTPNTTDQYTILLISMVKSEAVNTELRRLPKALDACAILLLTSATMPPRASTSDPKYLN